jgi:hypothetical protein
VKRIVFFSTFLRILASWVIRISRENWKNTVSCLLSRQKKPSFKTPHSKLSLLRLSLKTYTTCTSSLRLYKFSIKVNSMKENRPRLAPLHRLASLETSNSSKSHTLFCKFYQRLRNPERTNLLQKIRLSKNVFFFG